MIIDRKAVHSGLKIKKELQAKDATGTQQGYDYRLYAHRILQSVQQKFSIIMLGPLPNTMPNGRNTSHEPANLQVIKNVEYSHFVQNL
jgi:hypothetical protein